MSAQLRHNLSLTVSCVQQGEALARDPNYCSVVNPALHCRTTGPARVIIYERYGSKLACRAAAGSTCGLQHLHCCHQARYAGCNGLCKLFLGGLYLAA